MAIEDLQKHLKSLPVAELPILERLKAVIWTRILNPVQTQPDTLLSMQEVAIRLNIPVSKAYELVRQGRLQGVRVGKYVRVRPATLEQYQASLVAA